MPGWPKNIAGQVINTPVIADLDNDGQLEVVASTSADYDGLNEGTIFVWNEDGSDMAPFPKIYQIAGHFLDFASTPAVGDLDGDRDLEILVGFKDGSLHALHHDGTDVVGWPKQVHSDFTVFGVILGDIDADGRTEVVASSTNSLAVFAWESDGSLMPGWPVGPAGQYSVGEPTLANLDADEQLEVVFHSNSDQIFALNHDGTPVPGWPVDVDPNVGNPTWAPPAIADIDADGAPEIIQASDEKRVHAWRVDGTPVTGWPKSIASVSYQATPALADVDDDGLLELVVVDREQLYMWDLSGPSAPEPQWPTYRGNNQRTGVYPNPVPTLVSIEPESVPSGGLPFTLVVQGSRFVAGSRILWNGVERETTFTGTTQLEALIPSAEIQNPQRVDVSVHNPGPGGGRTPSLSMDVCAGPPAPLGGLEFTDGETLIWVDPGDGSTFALYRGQLGSAYDHVCLEPGIEEPTTSDAEVPTEGFYYLVTAVNACGEGSPGTSSGGGPRDPQAVCP